MKAMRRKVPLLILGVFVFLVCLKLSFNNTWVADLMQRDFSRPPPYIRDENQPTPVVIFTYMRSGSSFVGDIIQANKDAFYLFEPLRSLQFAIRKKMTFHYFDGSNRTYDNFLNAAVDALVAWFTCDFKALPVVFYEDVFLSFSRKAKAFRTCLDYKTSKEHLPTVDAMFSCVNILESLCMKSKYIVVKAIRIPLDLLEPLMDRFPHMRIIYLLRDPRAVIRSQMSYGVVQKFRLSSNATRYCNRVYRDLVCSGKMQKRYFDRMYGLTYEELAKNPIKTAKALYAFLKMKFTPDIMAFVRNITSAGRTCNTPLCTVVSNSTLIVDKWREQVTFDFVKTVDSVCSPLYSLMGLRAIPSEKALRDKTFSSRGRNADIEMGDYRFA